MSNWLIKRLRELKRLLASIVESHMRATAVGPWSPTKTRGLSGGNLRKVSPTLMKKASKTIQMKLTLLTLLLKRVMP